MDDGRATSTAAHTVHVHDLDSSRSITAQAYGLADVRVLTSAPRLLTWGVASRWQPGHTHGGAFASRAGMFADFRVPLDVDRIAETNGARDAERQGLGLAAQLAYYFFLALFPALLLLLTRGAWFSALSGRRVRH